MAYLDGELQAERATVVQAHVAGCGVCERLSRDLRGVSRDMARWHVERAPATLVAPMTSAGTERKAPSRFAWLRARPALASALGAASVVVAVGIVGYGRLFVQTRDVRGASTSMASQYSLSESANMPSVGRAGRVAASSSGGSGGVEAGSLQRLTTPKPVEQVSSGAPATRPSIARTARLRVRTTDFDAARPVVDRVLADTGGLVGNVRVSGTRGDARSLTATLLIPASRLDAALMALKAVGPVLEESQSGDDVTEQVVDVEARLSNARKTEKRLVDLLQKRTGNLADVLAAEREIARVREEIERFDAQRKNLERRVTYATLNLEVTEEQHAALDLGPQPVSGMFRDAFVAGITEAVNSALGFCLFVVRVGPMLLLWSAILAWPVWAAVRWSRRPARS